MDNEKEFEVDGKTHYAIKKRGCEGCSFVSETGACSALEDKRVPSCVFNGNYVIFVEKHP